MHHPPEVAEQVLRDGRELIGEDERPCEALSVHSMCHELED